MNSKPNKQSSNNLFTPQSLKSSGALSVENIQSLNAAYTTIPSYSNDFESSNRSRTLGRIIPVSPAYGTSPHRIRKPCNFMSSFPNLSTMSSGRMITSQDPISNKNGSNSSYQVTARTGKTVFPVNGEDKSNPNSDDSLFQLQQDYEALQRDMDLKDNKLQASMNSIKTFWSPELKKERSLRKEESRKVIALREELMKAQEENQNSVASIQSLEEEVRIAQSLTQMLHNGLSSPSQLSSSEDLSALPFDPNKFREICQRNERLDRENLLLQQTVGEMESTIEAVHDTLATRDKTIHTLMNMMQRKGMSVSDDKGSDLGVEVDALKAQLGEYEHSLVKQSLLLEEKDAEIEKLKQINCDVFDDSSDLKTLQAVMQAKDTKIVSLENILRNLEDELTLLRRDKATLTLDRNDDARSNDAIRTQVNSLKTQSEQLKSQLQKKETELLTLQTKLVTMSNQQSDSRQHIDVLKESLIAKEQSSAILQSEVETLRARLDGKQELLEQKQEQLNSIQEEKVVLESDASHLRNTMDVKDRKMTVLLKKIDSLKDSLNERDDRVNSMKSQLLSLQQNTSSFDATVSSMENALFKKEENLNRLNIERDFIEEKLETELEEVKKRNRTLEKMLDDARDEINDNNINLNELKDKASFLASSDLKKDSKIKQLESLLEQKSDEVSRFESQLKTIIDEAEINKTSQSTALTKYKEESKQKIEQLEKLVEDKKNEIDQFQKQLDRIVTLLTQTENEKHTKDEKISSLEKERSELQAKVKTLNTQMSEELKRKGAIQSKDMANYLAQLQSSKDRVEELEVALKESISMTSEKEKVVAQERKVTGELQNQIKTLLVEYNKTKSVLTETGKQLASCKTSIHEKDRIIHDMKKEKREQLQEAFSMKHKALLSEISEKDTSIALLELSNSHTGINNEEIIRLQRQKDGLVQQLKQENQNSLHFLQDSEEMYCGKDKRHNPDDEGEGIWA